MVCGSVTSDEIRPVDSAKTNYNFWELSGRAEKSSVQSHDEALKEGGSAGTDWHVDGRKEK
jgi:hypothetical protein